LSSGVTNSDGLTDRVFSNHEADLVAMIGGGNWEIEEYDEDDESDLGGTGSREPT